MSRRPPANNPLKLPFFALGVLGGLVMVVIGIATRDGRWALIIIGALTMLISAAALRVIRQGRNPLWLRAPIDYVYDRRRR